MAVTKEQWAEVEKNLSGMFGEVALRCDGYDIKACITNVAPMRQGIAVYVNGWIKGEWVTGDAEEARKFYREMKRFLYPENKRKEASAKAKKRGMDAVARKICSDIASSTFSTWAPYWTNAKAFTRHLRKTCKDIEIVSIGASF